MHNTPTPREKAIWRAAMTLAHNWCTQASDRINADDGPLGEVRALSDAAKWLRGWVEPSDDQLMEMFQEAGVPGCERQDMPVVRSTAGKCPMCGDDTHLGFELCDGCNLDEANTPR